jgi:hypothetical protein
MKYKFKEGDKVYAIDNMSWGLEPMTVCSIFAAAGSVFCNHPTYGNGAFNVNNLKLASNVTAHRKRELKAIREHHLSAARLIKKIFLDKRGG